LVLTLKDDDVVGWDIEECSGDESPRHQDVLCICKHGLGVLVDDCLGQVGLIDNFEDLVRALNRESNETGVLDDEDLVLRVLAHCCLILRDLQHDESVAFELCLSDWSGH
jgi:hypothetical protein